MSGDVQPRKRKDKKKKKDDLGVEEPRGTAAAFGEGDVFMHSQSEHGTGGHWCAKVIFFSLLAVLITLIGLIILENRGLTELEANSVESRYSGVLEGWIEDAPDDDHHDEHTLELKHHDEDDADHGSELDDDHDENDEHDNDEDENSHDDENDDDDEADHDADDDEADQDADESEEADDGKDDDGSEEQDLNIAEDEDDIEEPSYSKYYKGNEKVKDDDDDDDDDDDLKSDNQLEDSNEDDDEKQQQDDDDDDEKQQDDEDDDDEKHQDYDDDDDEQHQDDDDDDDDDEKQNDVKEENESREDNTLENNDDDDDSEENDYLQNDANEDEEEHEEEPANVEIEAIEKEVSDNDASVEEPAQEEEQSEGASEELSPNEDDSSVEDDDVEFLEPDELDELPIVEPITAPKGKPLPEVEESPSTEKPQDTLAEEEEYERQQEELRKEKEQASQGKDGGNSIEDEWPGEPADTFWNEHLEQAQRELRQGEWMAAAEKASNSKLQSSARARYINAQALDAAAEAKKDNQLLNQAITAYLEVLKMNEKLSDKKLREVATRTLDRIKFRGTYLSAEPVYKLLIRRFPNEPAYRNNLTISLLMANRADLAENVLKETLKLWPNDRIALAHHGFILKTLHNRLEEAVEAFTKALEGDAGAANEPRFYYHLGDALLLLGRFEEAHEVHKRGAALGHFLSPSQRSLYNVDRLKSRPWWNVDETPYSKIARALEKSWKEILKEGKAAKELYEKEKEGLKERGDWSQLDLFIRGREIPNRCARAPVTCGIVKAEIAASGCRRGQIKFSMMEAGTHVRPHVGPTNCRLRMHLGLSNTKDTFIRVDRETRQWQTGKVLMFDDSFEHEVWHNGTGARLVLIVDVWHPDLTPAERRQLPAI